jgi:hypothetical protein
MCSTPFPYSSLYLRSPYNFSIVISQCSGVSDGASALHIAAKAGHVGAVKKLIAAGARVDDETTLYGLTPLYFAARFDRSNTIVALLESGADAGRRPIRSVEQTQSRGSRTGGGRSGRKLSLTGGYCENALEMATCVL